MSGGTSSAHPGSECLFSALAKRSPDAIVLQGTQQTWRASELLSAVDHLAARIAGTDRLALILETVAAADRGGPFVRRLVAWVPPGPAEALVLQAAAGQGGLRRHAMRELKDCSPPSPRFAGRRVTVPTAEWS